MTDQRKSIQKSVTITVAFQISDATPPCRMIFNQRNVEIKHYVMCQTKQTSKKQQQNQKCQWIFSSEVYDKRKDK